MAYFSSLQRVAKVSFVSSPHFDPFRWRNAHVTCLPSQSKGVSGCALRPSGLFLFWPWREVFLARGACDPNKATLARVAGEADVSLSVSVSQPVSWAERNSNGLFLAAVPRFQHFSLSI